VARIQPLAPTEGAGYDTQPKTQVTEAEERDEERGRTCCGGTVLQLEAAKKEFSVHTHTRPFRARPFQQAASFCGSKNSQELSRVKRLLTLAGDLRETVRCE
jgi:hypothetical protein